MKISPWQLACIAKFYKIYTTTFRYTSPDQEKMDSLIRKKIPVLAAFFHEELISAAPSLQCYSLPVNALAITSASKDGDIVEALCSAYNIKTVRGSSSRNGAKVLREIKRRIYDEDISIIVIAIDGPRGPRREVKPGIIYLSHLLKIPIIPCRFFISHSKTLHNMWDKNKIPLPFAKICVRFGDPYYITGELNPTLLHNEQRILKENLENLEEK